MSTFILLVCMLFSDITAKQDTVVNGDKNDNREGRSFSYHAPYVHAHVPMQRLSGRSDTILEELNDIFFKGFFDTRKKKSGKLFCLRNYYTFF